MAESMNGLNPIPKEPKIDLETRQPVGGDDYSGPGFENLPESWIAAILSRVTPRDVARLACTCRSFREASNSDSVWQNTLPPHYTDILAQASDAPPITSTKREIYNYLSRDRVLLKNGTQDFWLDRATGGVCRSIGARGMGIVWGDDPRYWHWATWEGSRFPEVAYLRQVCWFEVQGHLECFFPPGVYTLSWRLCLADNPMRTRAYVRYPSGHVYGWNRKPVNFSFKTSDDQEVLMEHFLTTDDGGALVRPNRLRSPGPTSGPSEDTWMEIRVGEFTVEDGDKPFGVSFSMIEIQGGNWKSGLFLDSVVIRPSHLARAPKQDAAEEHTANESAEGASVGSSSSQMDEEDDEPDQFSIDWAVNARPCICRLPGRI